MNKRPVGKKDLSSKLAGTVRAARTEQLAKEEVKKAKPAKAQTTRPPAQQSGQTPVPSLNDPQGTLHPARIWPD